MMVRFWGTRGSLPVAQTATDVGAKLATASVDGADHKSRLQELSAHLFGMPPRYEVEATGPDHQDFCVLESSLADRADLRNDQVARVAFHLIGAEVPCRVNQRSGPRIQLRLGCCGAHIGRVGA